MKSLLALITLLLSFSTFAFDVDNCIVKRENEILTNNGQYSLTVSKTSFKQSCPVNLDLSLKNVSWSNQSFYQLAGRDETDSKIFCFYGLPGTANNTISCSIEK